MAPWANKSPCQTGAPTDRFAIPADPGTTAIMSGAASSVPRVSRLTSPLSGRPSRPLAKRAGDPRELVRFATLSKLDSPAGNGAAATRAAASFNTLRRTRRIRQAFSP